MTPDTESMRAILERDRAWAVYALGDLEPLYAAFAEWRRAADDTALVLLYREFGVPVLFTFGPSANVAPLLHQLADRELYLSIQPEILPLLEHHYTVRDLTPMWRMLLDPASFTIPNAGDAARLSAEDFAALEALYADGAATHEAPDFFIRLQLERGVFFGLYEDSTLIAAAGTHLVSSHFSLGAIGNVYVRADRRGHGLGRRVTEAVTAELVRMGLQTIALNVKQENAAAIRVYERLGFRRYCPFYEGVATLK
ncbi:MAG: GNAT family N-acetyltransferase [Anaerolineales bacterium]